MSLRQVLTIYNAERQLSDDETALLNTLRKMTDAERGMFVEGLTDKSQKKAGKKSASKSSGKSARASSLQEQIQKRQVGSLKPSASESPSIGLDDDDGSTDPRCQFTRTDNKPCHLLPDHNIHHLESANEYHPFVGDAASVGEPSSASNAATSGTQNSETQPEGVSSVHHVASGGE